MAFAPPPPAPPPGAAVDLSTGEIVDADANVLLQRWREAKDALDAAKADESDLRDKVVRTRLPSAIAAAGTYNFPLGLGWVLKIVKPATLAINDATNEQVSAALTAAAAVRDSAGKVPPEISNLRDVVTWEPKLSKKAYDALVKASDPVAAAAYAAALAPILVLKPGKPTIEVQEPKDPQ
jgi:hypothetical protein